MDEKESLKKVVALRQVIESIHDENPTSLENKYYSSFGCNDERDKILLEVKYVQSMLKKKADQLIETEDYTVDLNILRIILIILNNSKHITPGTYKALKQSLIDLEIKYGIRIRLYSEAVNMYHEEVSKLKR